MDSFLSFDKFDVIFCRNVMIYFDDKTKNELIDKFVERLNPKGFFICGHSEVFDFQSRNLVPVGKTIFQKEEGG